MITDDVIHEWARTLDSIHKHEVKIAVVGSREGAWNKGNRAEAQATVGYFIGRASGQYMMAASAKALTVISGACPKGGVDIWARDLCNAYGIDFIEYPPGFQVWGGKNGYKARNDRIAEECDIMLVVRSTRSNTRGSAYTGERAEALGKPVVWVTI